MTPDVSTGDPTRSLCLNCARRIVTPRTVSKYQALGNYLKFRGAFTQTVKLEFARIDGIIGDNLPMDAYKSESWWSNSPTNMHAKAWLDTGWLTQEVNLKEGYVIFKKAQGVRTGRAAKRSSDIRIKKPFTPVHFRVPKARTPSQTKASRLYARIKNLERQRSMPRYHGGLRPKPKHEKKLFKPDEKPQ